jgi:hypothetical protein
MEMTEITPNGFLALKMLKIMSYCLGESATGEFLPILEMSDGIKER